MTVNVILLYFYYCSDLQFVLVHVLCRNTRYTEGCTHTHTHTHSHPQHKLQTTLAEFIGQEKHGVPVLIGLFARQKKSKELYNL